MGDDQRADDGQHGARCGERAHHEPEAGPHRDETDRAEQPGQGAVGRFRGREHRLRALRARLDQQDVVAVLRFVRREPGAGLARDERVRAGGHVAERHAHVAERRRSRVGAAVEARTRAAKALERARGDVGHGEAFPVVEAPRDACVERECAELRAVGAHLARRQRQRTRVLVAIGLMEPTGIDPVVAPDARVLVFGDRLRRAVGPPPAPRLALLAPLVHLDVALERERIGDDAELRVRERRSRRDIAGHVHQPAFVRRVDALRGRLDHRRRTFGQAVAAAHANAERNGVTALFADSTQPMAGEYDLVVANILSNPLRVLAPAICAHVRSSGRLALSGILREQAEEINAIYAQWLPMQVADVRETWHHHPEDDGQVTRGNVIRETRTGDGQTVTRRYEGTFTNMRCGALTIPERHDDNEWALAGRLKREWLRGVMRSDQ